MQEKMRRTNPCVTLLSIDHKLAGTVSLSEERRYLRIPRTRHSVVRDARRLVEHYLTRVKSHNDFQKARARVHLKVPRDEPCFIRVRPR